mmetsp:Transcript_14770/g.21096  ORF Transcript_14770/g.21096 Transcript_14770/m.21096 type:complete len:431 (+) Transcript_14770:208-1500(+)|eukprot:CAMPEP_0184866814 /NCGR_PEP_ID=MMETSP0580-20130426/23838_1 /TAXON_ID=1118495 /ORGANISM="Dactyliosolen fragilissimus" /LENGTH=430 /DNA_ID=CAMNT_0027366699 /DNA_START=134 /DNA_END=1426 /DNA_ORIENTATION=+
MVYKNTSATITKNSSTDAEDITISVTPEKDILTENFENNDAEARDDVCIDSPNLKADKLEQNSSIKSVTSNEPTLLFSYIKFKRWASVVKRCRSLGNEKSEAGIWVVETNNDGSIRWKSLPLHQACENGAPSEVVKALLEAYPYAVQMKDSGGDLPLHLACRERASKAVLLTLLEADPKASKVADDEGRLPLHLACRQGADVEVIDQMLIYYHRASRIQDSYFLLPLHWACAQNANASIVKSLLRAHPHAVDEKDKWGRSALSLAHASTNPEKDDIVHALQKDPSYWTTTLLNEVGGLKTEVEEQKRTIEKTDNKAALLEIKLAEVTKTSALAAQSYRELKDELEAENECLKDKIKRLSRKNESQEEIIEKLKKNNNHIENQIKTMNVQLESIATVFRGMEDKRMQLLKFTGDMEESLQKAANIIGDDHF